MDADLRTLEEMVMKSGEVTATTTTTETPVVKPQTFVVPQPPPVLQSYQHESLQCFQCFITFCNSKAKERHMKKSHREEYKQQLQQNDTLFTCYVCDRTFSSSEDLTQHQSTHNKEDKPFKCAHCKESFRTFSELTSHKRQVCPERQFQCKYCSLMFRSPAMLRNHRIALHPQEDPAAADATKFHRCPKCNSGFSTEAELLQHQENHAGSQNCNGGPPAKKAARGRPPKADATGAAVEGDKQVKRKKKAEAAGEEEGKEEAQVPSPQKQTKPRKKKAEAVLEEEKGAEQAETKEAAATTTKAAGAPKRGRPPKAAATSAKAAEEKKAPPKKPHPCGDCEESFVKPEQLQAHVNRVHKAGRFSCPTCGKSFGRESNLKAHQQSHTKDGEGEEKKKKATGRGKR